MLTFHQQQTDLRLSVTRSDYIQLTPHWNDPNATLSCTRLYFIESGAGYLTIQGQKYPLEPGFVYLVPAYFKFGYGCTGMKKLYFHIRITDSNPKDILSGIDRVLKLPYEPAELQALLSCYKATDVYGILKLQGLLTQTICRFAEAYDLPHVALRNYSEPVKQAMSIIQAAPSLKHTGKAIAQQLFISESRLRNAFKNELGTTIGDYIDLCVFRQAKSLLRTSVSLEQISQQLGFCDQFYFSRRFKQRYGVTPSQYRKQLFTEQT